MLTLPFPARPLLLLATLLSIAACNTQQEPAPVGSQPVSQEVPAPRPAEAAEPPQGADAGEAPAPRPAQLLTAEELGDGWIALFDGATLFGWEPASEANWRVENGSIVVDQGQAGLLCTTSQFGDFVLKLEFRSALGTNSGIFLHTPLKPEDPAADCYELNIADSDNPFPTGSLVRRQKAEGNFDSQEWQAYEVTVRGPRVTVILDGEQVLDYTAPQSLGRGRIGLQLNQGQVEFRRLKLKPLGLESIFNGRDLTGWNTYDEMASKWTVTEDGYLNVKNGRGQLETQQFYGDFLFQLECIAHAPELNSGIFFRCIPGDVMMGYESQIHNGFLDSDRSRPKDCGTGGIFRRQDARLVVADDNEWFHKTIVADGPHVAVWVNGYQVSDWTDQRPPHENPRQGLRLESGTIMIQGHDPTTDLSFRNLRIAETPARQQAASSNDNAQ